MSLRHKLKALRFADASIIRTPVAVLCLCLLPFAWGPAHPSLLASSSDSVAIPTQDAMEGIVAMAETTRTILEQTHFSLNAIQERVGSEPTQLAEWVQSSTRWVPSNGLLKDPHAVWVARQGNQLERSFLLQQMLASAGVPARVAYAPIPSQRMEPYLERMLRRPEGDFAIHRPSLSLLADPHWIKEAAKWNGWDLGKLQEDAAQFKQASIAFEASLQEQTISIASALSPHPAPESLRSSASLSHRVNTHYWVQYQQGANWIDLCPVFGEQLAEFAVLSGQRTLDSPASVPQHQRHRFQVELKIVQTANGVEKTRSVLKEKWDAHELSNAQILFAIQGQHALNNPDSMVAAMKDPQSFLEASQETIRLETTWIPSLTGPGNTVYASLQFDSNGNVSRVGTAPRNTGSAIVSSGGFGALTGGAQPVDSGELSRVYLEFTITAPGQPIRQVQRDLFRAEANEWVGSRLKETARDRRAFAMTQSRVFQIQTGMLSGDWVDLEQARALREANLAMRYLIRSSEQNLSAETLGTALDRILPRVRTLETGLLRLASLRGDPSSYLANLNVVTWVRQDFHASQPSGPLRSLASIDWIHNRIDSLHHDPEARWTSVLHAGIRDTILETEILETGEGEVTSASHALLASTSVSQEWTRVDTLQTLEAISIDPRYRDGLESDLRSGYHLWVHHAQAGKSWWRLDPKTGECLGMATSDLGWGGQASIEYEEVMEWAVGYLLNLVGFLECLLDTEGDPVEGLKCAGCFLGSLFSGHLAIAKLSGKAGTAASWFSSTVNFLC